MSSAPGRTPPVLAQAILAFCLPAGLIRDGVLGDLGEAYERRLASGSTSRVSRLWYWREALSVGGRYLMVRVTRRRVAHGTDPGVGRGATMSDLWTDIRLAFRAFYRAPGFTLASVSVLGLGLGAVTLMFSTLHSVVLEPLPYPQPDRLVWAWGNTDAYPRNSMSALNYMDVRDGVDAFESLAAFHVFRSPAVLTGAGEPERVVGDYVTANLFSTMGVEPVLGRGFVPSEQETGVDQVVVLSYGVWQRRFGGERDVLGATVTLDGLPHEVVGIMPAGFDYPGGVDIWRPAQWSEGYAQGRSNNNFSVVGRLRDGATLAQAQAQADVVASQLERAYPGDNLGWRALLQPLHERYLSGLRTALVLLLGIVSLVLVIACANVASLALARATTRRSEVAVRLSLGASRRRVIRQLLTEHFITAMAGGALGLALAAAGLVAIKAFGPASLPRLEEAGIDGVVAVFAFAVAAVVGLAFGTLPALRGTDLDLSESLKSGGRGAIATRTGGRSALVVVQVALSVMLMIASGLLVRSFSGLQRVDPGFPAQGLLLAELQSPTLEGERAEVMLAWDQILEAVASTPGVRSVGAIDQLPIRGGGTTNGVFAQGRQPEHYNDYLPAQRRFVTEGYHAALGVPLVAGRTFAVTDNPESAPVTVINERLAQGLWPGENPVGRYMVLPWGEGLPLEVVGVVGDTRDFGQGSDAPPMFYMSFRQYGDPGTLRLVMRTDGDSPGIGGRLREAVWGVNPNMPVSAVQTMESRLAESVAQPRFRTTLVALFAMAALILASLGLYAVLAFFVRQRTQEFAVRMAVGAGHWDVMRLVLRRGMVLVGAGIVLGLLGGLAGGRLLQTFLFGVQPGDFGTMAAVTLTMVGVTLVACLVPARRAVRIAPVRALNSM